MRIVLVLAVAGLAGCATGPSRSQVLASLVGHPEADVIRTLGAPNRILDANGSRFLAYDERNVSYPAGPGFFPYGPFGYGYFYPTPAAYAWTCETTIEVAGGLMRSWNLRGNGC